MEVVQKLRNFVVYNFFIWIHLALQIVILIPAEYRIRGTGMVYRHKDLCGAVVKGGNTQSRGRGFESHHPRSARKLLRQVAGQ